MSRRSTRNSKRNESTQVDEIKSSNEDKTREIIQNVVNNATLEENKPVVLPVSPITPNSNLLMNIKAIIRIQSIFRSIRSRRLVRRDSLLQAWNELDKAEEFELQNTHKQYKMLKEEMAKKLQQKQETKQEEIQKVATQEVVEDIAKTTEPPADPTEKRNKRSRSQSPTKHLKESLVPSSPKRVRPSTPVNDNKFTHLPTPLNLDFVQKLLDYFKSGKKLPKTAVEELLNKVKPILEDQPNIVHINVTTRITIVGDLHGQLNDLLEIFRLQGEPSDRNYFVFNGDFVDRGQSSCECVLILFAFKLLYPSAINLNRGNHESQDINSRDGFEKECLQKYNGKIFQLFSEVFATLPLATILNKSVFITHGGLFHKTVTLNEINSIPRFQLSPDAGTIFEEMLWSDPQENNGRSPNSRGAGLMFGPDVTKEFLKKNKLKLIVRSHECMNAGFNIHHQGLLYTVFSASNYCGTVGNKGAILVFESEALKNNELPRIIQYYASKGENFSHRLQSMENSVINKLIPRIADNRLALLSYYRKLEILRKEKQNTANNNNNNNNSSKTSKRGKLTIQTASPSKTAGKHSIPSHINYVSRSEWAEGLKTILHLNIPYLDLQDRLGLPKLGVDGKFKGPIDYVCFLNRFRPINIIQSNIKRTESDLKLPPELAPGKSLESNWNENSELSNNNSVNNSGNCSATEGLHNLLEMLYRNRFDLESLFRHFDVNNDQTIDCGEFKEGILSLQHILKVKFNESEVDSLIKHIDTNNDGQISYQEFFTAFNAANLVFNDENSNSALVVPLSPSNTTKPRLIEPESPPTPLIPTTMDDY